MRFIQDGPDIPERLLQAQEEGRVVFFCGAGISYSAGLPDFRGLVDRMYTELGTTRTTIEDQAYKNNQYDATLELLERRYPGKRLAVRTALANVLKPKWRRKGATTTHKALLQLTTDRQGKVRLVTTNFDRIFRRVMKRNKQALPDFAAPLLPIPKPSRWHGVVHLHGLLPDSLDEIALNRLVLTSGDFGLAYLTERWAARFVSDLFRYFTVCFVGYSINDPVLRYMMDALAVDEMLGESRPEAYAVGSFVNEEKDQALLEWEAKGVTPLLYEVPAGTKDHSALHLTLKEWAETYHDGVRRKEMIVAQHATTPPLTPSRLDYAVGRVLWALTDGLAAKHFADLNPVPPLEWLEPLTAMQFEHRDLSHFGVVPRIEEDNKLAFSVIRRPAPYGLAPWMTVADDGPRGSEWDDVMYHLARWLTRHLDDPALVLWLAKRGGQLHERLARLVQLQIEDIDRLENDGKQKELDCIRMAAPKAVPSPLMRTLWRLILSGRLKSHAHDFDLYVWLRRFKQDGLTPTLRMELREILMPRIAIREPFYWDAETAETRVPRSIKDLLDWELVLSTDHVHSELRVLSGKLKWQSVLPDLLIDLTVLLRDALDLMAELGSADDKSDLSYFHQPSIEEHPQNRYFHDWTALIDLTRDAWLATMQCSLELARLAAEGWWQVPYPLFKRLAFFAAAQRDVLSSREALDWLLADGHWWLWSVETKREAMRLLVVLTPNLNSAGVAVLEHAILQGPPRDMFKDGIEPERWTHMVDREVWLRLAKAQAAGAVFRQATKAKLDELTQKYPDWQLAEDERDEFPYWMGDVDEWREIFATPRRRRELVLWLKQHPSSGPWRDDDWRQRCRDDFPTTGCALFALSQDGEWPVERWREALQAWAEDKLLRRSWRYMAQVLVAAPDDLIQKLAYGLSWWLKSQAKTFEGREKLFFGLIRRLLELEHEVGAQADVDPVFSAINHPVGHVTEALLRWWYRQEPKDEEGLKDEVKFLFNRLCDTRGEKFRHGRVLLASHAISLFRVDQQWVRKYLLPLFDWQWSEVEARAAWEGFLWSPRLYRPLMTAIRQPLLATATHYAKLGKHAEQYATFLTFAALDRGDTFTAEELADATRALPEEGLSNVAQALVRTLEGAGEQRGEYWRNRVLPYLRSIWPKTHHVITPAISESLARLCVAAHESFPEALGELRHWLQPLENPDFVVHLLQNAELCDRCPETTLLFLDIVVGNETRWPPNDLEGCLRAIVEAEQNFHADFRYKRLMEHLRRHGRD